MMEIQKGRVRHEAWLTKTIEKISVHKYGSGHSSTFIARASKQCYVVNFDMIHDSGHKVSFANIFISDFMRYIRSHKIIVRVMFW